MYSYVFNPKYSHEINFIRPSSLPLTISIVIVCSKQLREIQPTGIRKEYSINLGLDNIPKERLPS